MWDTDITEVAKNNALTDVIFSGGKVFDGEPEFCPQTGA